MASPKESIATLTSSSPVVVYAKSHCPHCAKTKALLTELGVHFELVDLDKIPEGEALESALHELTGQRTVPNIFIGAKSRGGNSDLQELHKNGQLVPLLREHGALA
ncbi:hypothetical protein PybrP1_001184 [[Pythium] brassicae (nom. inval.)]|nr:hypothetical protein PybrP1_001184 [[Pythium] brassicae (nom. inval.)]